MVAGLPNGSEIHQPNGCGGLDSAVTLESLAKDASAAHFVAFPSPAVFANVLGAETLRINSDVPDERAPIDLPEAPHLPPRSGSSGGSTELASTPEMLAQLRADLQGFVKAQCRDLADEQRRSIALQKDAVFKLEALKEILSSKAAIFINQVDQSDIFGHGSKGYEIMNPWSPAYTAPLVPVPPSPTTPGPKQPGSRASVVAAASRKSQAVRGLASSQDSVTLRQAALLRAKQGSPQGSPVAGTPGHDVSSSVSPPPPDTRPPEIHPDSASGQAGVDDDEEKYSSDAVSSMYSYSKAGLQQTEPQNPAEFGGSMIERTVAKSKKFVSRIRSSVGGDRTAYCHTQEEGPLIQIEEPKPWGHEFIHHPFFDAVSSVLVALNTAVTGVETNYRALHKGESNHTFEQVNNAMFVLFSIELATRFIAMRSNFFCDKADRAWNMFDSLLVTVGALELIYANMDVSEVMDTSRTTRVIRIARLLRILKVVRLGRMLRYAHTFKQIVYSLKSSVNTLLWTIGIVFLLLYCWAIFFCQATTDYLSESAFDPLRQDLDPDVVSTENLLYKHYRSVPVSLYSLYKCFTGGQSWGELMDPLGDLHPVMVVMFLAFITVMVFGVLNVVAAIFVESALQSQEHYRDLLIQENVYKKQIYKQHLQEIFHEIDQDGSGFINAEEMEVFLADPELNLYLESIDIFPNDARALFRLLDDDSSGEISIDEFCEGCLRLKGEAKSFDVHCMMHNNMVLIRKTQRISDMLDTILRQTTGERNQDIGLYSDKPDSVTLERASPGRRR